MNLFVAKIDRRSNNSKQLWVHIWTCQCCFKIDLDLSLNVCNWICAFSVNFAGGQELFLYDFILLPTSSPGLQTTLSQLHWAGEGAIDFICKTVAWAHFVILQYVLYEFFTCVFFMSVSGLCEILTGPFGQTHDLIHTFQLCPKALTCSAWVPSGFSKSSLCLPL